MTETIIAEVRDAAYDSATNTLYTRLHALTAEAAEGVSGSLASHSDGHSLAWPNVGSTVSLFIDDVSADTLTDPAVLTPGTTTRGTTSDAGKATINTQARPSTMIVLCSTPASCNNHTTTNYTVNSTIYFTSTITQTDGVVNSAESYVSRSTDAQGERL